MKIATVLLLSCAALCCAQEPQTDTPEGAQGQVKRLASVTWDLASHKLVWIVEKGSVVNGDFVPNTKVKYEVSPDEKFMAYAGEKRSIEGDEGAALHHLLDVLSLYCVQSVVWWEHPPSDSVEPTSPGVVTKPLTDGKPIKMGAHRPVPIREAQILAARWQ